MRGVFFLSVIRFFAEEVLIPVEGTEGSPVDGGWGERRVGGRGGGVSRFSRGLPAVASAAAAAAIDCRRVAVTDSKTAEAARFEKGCLEFGELSWPCWDQNTNKNLRSGRGSVSSDLETLLLAMRVVCLCLLGGFSTPTAEVVDSKDRSDNDGTLVRFALRRSFFFAPAPPAAAAAKNTEVRVGLEPR